LYALNKVKCRVNWLIKEKAICFPSNILEAFAHCIPVHHIPESGEVFRAAVLVFEVIGMFPNVNT
jgi:hypothetical protein